MKIIKATCGNGYCGCDQEEVFFFSDNFALREIDTEVYSWSVENAESYAYVHFGWDEPYTDEDYEDYLENYVTYSWDEITYDEYLDYCENWHITPKTLEELKELDNGC